MIALMVGSRRWSRHVRSVVAWTTAVTLALTMAGCPADPTEPNRPDPEVALELTLAGGARDMTPRARDQLVADVGDALTSYVIGAFLGDYPRDDFVAALNAFTGKAAQEAAEDLDLLTASGLEDTTAVTASRLVASITAFAPDGEVGGASAEIDFAFEVATSGGTSHGLTLDGRLVLTPEQGTWKIFGYDVTQDDAAPAGGSS